MPDLWRGPVAMAWDGDRLMLGSVPIGLVWRYYWNSNVWHYTLGADWTGKRAPFEGKETARAALLAAAVRAVGGES